MNPRTSEVRSGGAVDLQVLDALRGLAALYVMLGHARWLLWAGNTDYIATEGNGIGWVLAVLSSGLRYGHEAVLLFFLLSGFCIHYRQAQIPAGVEGHGGIAPARFNVHSYAWRRLRRLYPPLVVALALTAVFDTLGDKLNPAFYAGHSPYSLINANLGESSYGVLTLLGGLLFQSTFAVPRFGTNGPLWSLSYEFWFYVLYPVLLMGSVRVGMKRTVFLIAAASGLALAAVQFTSPLFPWWILSIVIYWVVWATGAAIAEVYVGRLHPPGLRWLGLLGAAGLALLATVPLGLSETASDLMWSLTLASLLTYVMVGTQAHLRGLIEWIAYWLTPLGNISYSLYVVHFPWLALVSAWWLSSHQRLPLGAELAIPGAGSAIVLAAACWYTVERRFVSTRLPRRIVKHEVFDPSPAFVAGAASQVRLAEKRGEAIPQGYALASVATPFLLAPHGAVSGTDRPTSIVDSHDSQRMP